ncbi:LETM1-like protein-domain-containing protein [Multifurca ochricompacta]|uniref:LETM1-like protein-domain-containing protein n=1 Tax=Multifurca ochricompacta TaxID=376703 RepID=A0AAD4MB44_9AGAM|nr:LETM1-like protein-domain-containing protein [Multifurca ochricompacta]
MSRSLPLFTVALRNHAVHPRLINYLHARRTVLSLPQNFHHHHGQLVSRYQSTQTTTDPSSSPPSPPAPKNIKKTEPLLSRAWKKVKHEAQHYWHGSKLLAKEVRISARLQRKILQGETLTRRERRQLRRTTQDLLRVIPFAVFIMVPFMEFLLPVALKLFPNMLPSTFEDKFAAEEKARKLLRMRLEMAKFLQETLRESGLKANAHILGSDAFKVFPKVRSTGESPSTEDIINVAKLFDDDLTLDNLSRPQLTSMSRYMGLNAFGTDNFLRGAIRSRLLQLRRDDQAILAEGVDELSTAELQHACQSRGIRTYGVSPARLREDLNTWIQLHLSERVSGLLLVLGRAFEFDRKPGEDESSRATVVRSLEHVLSGLPDNLLNEAELEVDSEKASYKQRLEVLQQQEELIEDEEEQEQKEEDARRARRAASERSKGEEEARIAESLLPDSEQLCSEPLEEDARMTTEQLKEIVEVLSVLSAKSSVLKERDELHSLMEENQQSASEEDPKAAALVKRIRNMLTKLDKQLEEYDARVGSSLQLIACDAAGRIPIRDLAKALSMIRHRPEEDVVAHVVDKLDIDHDGYVELEHVLGLAREEGLGIVIETNETDARNLLGEIKESKPRKEDIVQE